MDKVCLWGACVGSSKTRRIHWIICRFLLERISSHHPHNDNDNDKDDVDDGKEINENSELFKIVRPGSCFVIIKA